MKKESRFGRIEEVLSGLIDMIVAGLLWLLCSLPIITVGASCSALYYAICKSVRHNRGRLTHTFFYGFRSCFRIATPVWLLMLLWTIIGTADAYAIERMGFEAGTVPFILSRIFFLPLLFFFPWIFAYVSRFENTLAGSIKYSAWLMLRHPAISLILGLELSSAILICWLLPLIIPLLPGALCLLVSVHIEPVFRPIQEAQDSSQDADTWYNE